jgi:signal transduction histidine kinase
VVLEADATSTISLSGRRANLVTLVLRNLLQNALEATPRGGRVKLTGRSGADGIEFLVEDGGAGLPDPVRARLFQPCASTKVGGSGLGLAISHRLAAQAGGKLELVRTDAVGTCFRLVLTPEA